MQIYDFVLAFHIYSLYTTGFLIIFYLALTQSSFSTEFNFIKRIRLFLPIHYLFLSIVFFTGMLLLALQNFKLNFSHLCMIVAWCGIIALNIFLFKQFKKARQIRKYKNFRALSFFILLLSFALLLAPFFCEYYL